MNSLKMTVLSVRAFAARFAVRLVPALSLMFSLVLLAPTIALGAGFDVPDAAPIEITASPVAASVTCLSGPMEHIDVCAQVALDAFVNKQWGLLVSLAVLLIVAGLRKFTPDDSKLGAWFRSKLGAIISNFVLSLGGGFATQFLAGAPFSAALVLKAITVALTASGGWAIYKNLREAINDNKAQRAGTAAAATEPEKVVNS